MTVAIEYFNTLLETCVWWEQRYPDNTANESEHWVSIVQVETTLMAAVPGWNVSGEINIHIYLGYKFAEEVLAGGNLWGKDEVSINQDLDDRGRSWLSSALHEMMHVMSFKHEHQRSDRDCWIFVSDRCKPKHKYKKKLLVYN